VDFFLLQLEEWQTFAEEEQNEKKEERPLHRP
jgi:hypothetical protein